MNDRILIALGKLIAACVAFVVLVGFCFLPIDRSLVAVCATFATIVMFPAVLLISIDTSRILKQEKNDGHSARILTIILALPQLALGLLLLLICLGAFLYQTYNLFKIGINSPFFSIIVLITSALMGYVGINYIRDAVRLIKESD